jgi:hypothetical protein
MVTGVFRLNVAVYGWPSFKLAWIIGMAVCTGALSVLRYARGTPDTCTVPSLVSSILPFTARAVNLRVPGEEN